MAPRRKTAKDTKNDRARPNGPDARRAQWLKGVLELCLLGVLRSGEAYGYEISQRLELAGLGKVKGGTLYPRLTALKAAGLVEIEWREGDGGPGRKYYRLTPNGRSTLVEAAAEFDRFTDVTRALINGETSESRTAGDGRPPTAAASPRSTDPMTTGAEG